MTGNGGTVWMVRPWITDFSAYDHMAQSRGFLSLAARLTAGGWDVRYMDCLPAPEPVSGRSFPGGRYPSVEIPHPAILAGIPRRYKRYGISTDAFRGMLDDAPAPDAILITTGMTYWYPGLVETVAALRRHVPGVPMAAGGIHATLQPDHLETLFRDYPGEFRVFPGPLQAEFMEWLAAATGRETGKIPPLNIDVPPAWSLAGNFRYAVLWTSQGCRHRCGYCAAHRFHSRFHSRSPADLDREMAAILRCGNIRDVALYDDDFADPAHITSFLHWLIRRHFPVRWHLPNALSIHSVTPVVAGMLNAAGFIQPRLSVNNVDRVLTDTGFSPETLDRFAAASRCLQRAGYEEQAVSAYILAGLPGQRLEGLAAAAEQLIVRGIRPYFSQFSPIPGTPVGDRRLRELGFHESGDLLLTNKLLAVYRHPGWNWREYYDLHAAVRHRATEEQKGAGD